VVGAVGIEPYDLSLSRDWHQNSGCARGDALITFVARNVRRVVTSFPRCLFAPARGGIFAEFAASARDRCWHKADIPVTLSKVRFRG
jgi:predicted membrane metal-binding protein